MTTNVATGQENAPTTRSRALHVGLWIAQGLLALAFALAGFSKAALPINEVFQKMPTLAGLPELLVRFIGVAEIAGVLGLILPSVTRIRPRLTALAGAGLATVMVLAIGHHLVRGEVRALPAPLLLGGVAAFIAWGRFQKAPISPRA